MSSLLCLPSEAQHGVRGLTFPHPFLGANAGSSLNQAFLFGVVVVPEWFCSGYCTYGSLRGFLLAPVLSLYSAQCLNYGGTDIILRALVSGSFLFRLVA